MRADQLLVDQGLAKSRSQAQRLIQAGVEWAIPPGPFKRVLKNSEDLTSNVQFRILNTDELRYVSRGGRKLEGALRQTGWSVKDLLCLDIGQSTGGFTHCLLEHGASRVIGIDVGHGQLHQYLRNDARVETFEGINVRHLDSLSLPTALTANRFELVVVDLSFISLQLVLSQIPPLMTPTGRLLLLVKPQFELQPDQIGKGGIVRNTNLYKQIRQRLEAHCEQLDLMLQSWFESPILGGDGNHEFFLAACKSANTN
jgi:23S rRNA (cytidine1920-2'-O)/16S rRNA (cytidine1409-2'-O)-methyltransferase